LRAYAPVSRFPRVNAATQAPLRATHATPYDGSGAIARSIRRAILSHDLRSRV